MTSVNKQDLSSGNHTGFEQDLGMAAYGIINRYCVGSTRVRRKRRDFKEAFSKGLGHFLISPTTKQM